MQVSPESQGIVFKLQCEEVIKDLEKLYKNSFNQLTRLELSERSIAKLTQLLLISRESAISPLKKEIDKRISAVKSNKS